ncbi:GMC oxidoreductase [Botrytis cinerea]
MSSNSYDFIIVGGGTSGLVVAARLTEDPSVRVLLLEAGEDHSADPRVITPGLWPALLGTDMDWALNGKKIPLSQGRLLGGSTAINGQAWIAPSKYTVDAWATFGNSSWTWDTISPYFQKSCTLTKPSPEAYSHLSLSYIDEKVQSKFTGPVQTSFAEEVNDPLPKAWVDTWAELGYGVTGDPFSGVAVGGYVNAMNIDPVTKQRSHALSAYYEPIKTRENLVVKTSAFVEKILLDGKTSDVVAKGVSYIKDGKTETATVIQEVILAAGVFATPKLLELSGIGSASLLESFDIPVIIDNANVGENLQDHLNAGFSFEVADGVKTVDALARQDQAAIGAAMEAYMEEQKGPFASGGNFAGGFLPVVDFLTPEGKKELAKLLQEIKDDGKPFTKSHIEFVNDLLNTPTEGSGCFFSYPAQGNFIPEAGSNDIMISANADAGNYFTICSMLLHPLSRGSSHITSSNPETKVTIDPKYLSNPLDLEVLARHIKEYVKKAALSAWHPTSTCAMLPLEKGGVVNEKLVVYGTKNLRIVDASVFPLATRGNCQTTVYAVAEKGADLIKADYGVYA